MSRKATICTISMNANIHMNRSSKEDRFKEAESKIRIGSSDHPDLFLLPEVFLLNDSDDAWRDEANIEEAGNETYQRLGALAKEMKAYIAAPLLNREDGEIYNSMVIFNRDGDPVHFYHKTFPTPTELEHGVSPGVKWPDCFEADFGKVACSICYDLNFQPLFKNYYDKGAEILLFSSYFPGGLLLQTWSYLYQWYAVSSHAQGCESVLLNKLGMVEDEGNMFKQTMICELELDCAVVPYWSSHDEVDAAKVKYGRDLYLDNHRKEGDVIMKYLGTDQTVEDILTEFGIRKRSEIYKDQHLT